MKVKTMSYNYEPLYNSLVNSSSETDSPKTLELAEMCNYHTKVSADDKLIHFDISDINSNERIRLSIEKDLEKFGMVMHAISYSTIKFLYAYAELDKDGNMSHLYDYTIYQLIDFAELLSILECPRWNLSVDLSIEVHSPSRLRKSRARNE